MNKQTITHFIIVSIIMVLFGCKENSTTPTEPLVPSYGSQGTITGLIKDRVTNNPVVGAVISLGYDGEVHRVVSDTAGAFSFSHVPIGQVVNGNSILSGTYTASISLVNYNAAQTDPNLRYRNFYYSPVTVIFTSHTQGDSLSIVDVVGSLLLQISHLNTSLAGQVVDQNMQSVANATVYLFDATVTPNILLNQTQTTSDGMYHFDHIDNGLSVNIKALSSDGSWQGTLPYMLTLPANLNTDSLRSQVTVERIMIKPSDDVSPYVISISPENNADVDLTNFQIVYTFSEPVKQTAYTRTDLGAGNHTMIDDIVLTYIGLKKTEGVIPFTAQWNSTYTQLTVVPSTSLMVGSGKYSIDMRSVFSSGKIQDLAGNFLANNSSITGDFELLQFTTNGNSPTPNAPQVIRRNIAGLFTTLDFNGGTVGLQWNNDNNARSYNIYRSVNDGGFELLQQDFYGLQFTNYTGSLVIPTSASDPWKAGSVRYLVRAVSKDLIESPSSNIITVTDEVKPRLAGVTGPISAGTTNVWNYTLHFSEPMILAGMENVNNYSFSDTVHVGFTINKADYLGNTGGQYDVQLTVTTSAALPAHYVLFIGNGITDLAGNIMDQTANNRAY